MCLLAFHLHFGLFIVTFHARWWLCVDYAMHLVSCNLGYSNDIQHSPLQHARLFLHRWQARSRETQRQGRSTEVTSTSPPAVAGALVLLCSRVYTHSDESRQAIGHGSPCAPCPAQLISLDQYQVIDPGLGFESDRSRRHDERQYLHCMIGT
ncbi:hypothetical protein BV25DRAFT_317491 [Artomyces pyxidatus]|uniref:Uncharacterized protein n=1 Tax=Artomyces pyxidatus TaxID=48021 RepID=A0ACB8T8B3_9AGAM|nr:hypothetical protein BV25DRAFT_317491 [Artomyces pyxidatus]